MYKDIVEHSSRQMSLLKKKINSFLALLSQVLSTADDIKSNLIEVENRFASLYSPDCEGVLVTLLPASLKKCRLGGVEVLSFG